MQKEPYAERKLALARKSDLYSVLLEVLPLPEELVLYRILPFHFEPSEFIPQAGQKDALDIVLRLAQHAFPRHGGRGIDWEERRRVYRSTELLRTLPALLRALIKPVAYFKEQQVDFLRLQDLSINESMDSTLLPLAHLYAFNRTLTKKHPSFLYDFLFCEATYPRTPLPSALREILKYFYRSLPAKKMPWLELVFQEWVRLISTFVIENKTNLCKFVKNTMEPPEPVHESNLLYQLTKDLKTLFN